MRVLTRCRCACGHMCGPLANRHGHRPDPQTLRHAQAAEDDRQGCEKTRGHSASAPRERCAARAPGLPRNQSCRAGVAPRPRACATSCSSVAATATWRCCACSACGPCRASGKALLRARCCADRAPPRRDESHVGARASCMRRGGADRRAAFPSDAHHWQSVVRWPHMQQQTSFGGVCVLDCDSCV